MGEWEKMGKKYVVREAEKSLSFQYTASGQRSTLQGDLLADHMFHGCLLLDYFGLLE